MKQVHHFIRSTVLAVVDFFYPPFKRLMPLQTFRYAACGGGNTLLNIFLFFIFHNYVLQKRVVSLGFYALKPYTAAFLMAFMVTFPIGFYLSMYVVFPGATLRRRIQLFRYFLVVIACIVLNYSFLKMFVEVFGWYPTPSLMITAVIVVAFSYFTQRHFSFSRKERN
ncbi:MAG TPA: GtrA family protein [Chitinophagaceae bacterium]